MCFISFLGFVFLLLPGLYYVHLFPSSLTWSYLELTFCPNSEGSMSSLVCLLVGWSSEGTFLYHSPLPSGPHGEWSRSQILVTFTESVIMRLVHLKVLICLFWGYCSSPLLSHCHIKALQLLREQKQSSVNLSEIQKG